MKDPRPVTKSFELSNRAGDLIRGDLRYCDDGHAKPAIIVCHSFMAFKDWGFFPYLGYQLALSGFASVVFDFSHNGANGRDQKISDFERFSQNTFSKELEDLNTVVEAVASNQLGKDVAARGMLALLGHSRGGGIAIIHTASDPRINALVSWSAVSTLDRWTPNQKASWKARGYLPLASDFQASPLRLGRELLSDIEQHPEALNILDAASRVNVPWLILHGEADVTVRPREAELLHRASNKPTTELLILEHVGHLYNASSPREDEYSMLNRIVQTTAGWLSQQLPKEYV